MLNCRDAIASKKSKASEKVKKWGTYCIPPFWEHPVDKKAAEDLDLEDRVPITEKREAFGTLKEGKEDFNSNPKMRLLNPCKLENLGWLSLLAHLPVVVGLYRHDGAVLSRLNPRETKWHFCVRPCSLKPCSCSHQQYSRKCQQKIEYFVLQWESFYRS